MYLIYGCLGFYIMYLKVTINKILFLFVDVNRINGTT